MEVGHVRAHRNIEREGSQIRSARAGQEDGEGTLNDLLEAEADDLVRAKRYERTAKREAYRAGHYDRGLTTSSGEATIHMPKLKGARFTTMIIERCRRRESSVKETMIEMYLTGVSTRRIENVSEILWGSSVSAVTVSNLNERAFASVEERRNRPLGAPTLASTLTGYT